MPHNRVRLLVGLGNPGKSYENTRHNVGFMVADKLASTYSIPLGKNKFDVIFGRGLVNGYNIIIAKPMAFMNESGQPIFKLANYFNILCEEMLVVHDDIDLTYTRLKIQSKGGHAGHKGIRSLIDAFGDSSFARIRVGIGRPESQKGVVSHVLGRFTEHETKNLDKVVSRAQDAAVTIINSNVTEAMNKFNRLE